MPRYVTRYDDYGHTYTTTWWAENKEVVFFGVLFTILFGFMAFVMMVDNAKAQEEAAQSCVQYVGTTVTVDGVEYHAKQFVPNASKMVHRIDAKFYVNTITNQLIVEWNANVFRGSEQTIDTGLIYNSPATGAE